MRRFKTKDAEHLLISLLIQVYITSVTSMHIRYLRLWYVTCWVSKIFVPLCSLSVFQSKILFLSGFFSFFFHHVSCMRCIPHLSAHRCSHSLKHLLCTLLFHDTLFSAYSFSSHFLRISYVFISNLGVTFCSSSFFQRIKWRLHLLEALRLSSLQRRDTVLMSRFKNKDRWLFLILHLIQVYPFVSFISDLKHLIRKFFFVLVLSGYFISR